MLEFFYPTEPGWIELMWKNWKNSHLQHLSFPFLNSYPSRFPNSPYQRFWMYLYYSESSTQDATLKGTVQYRVRVIDHNRQSFPPKITHIHYHNNIQQPSGNEKIWFLVDRIEEIECNNRLLEAKDFNHADPSKRLLQAIVNSIAPCICNCKIHTKRNYP